MINMINKELWKKCAEHHGHECPGLAIGYRASLYAAELLGVEPGPGSGVSCVAETDKCPVDAVRVIFGCTEQNGKLSFDLTGEMALTFTAPGGKSVRLELTDLGHDLPKAEKFTLFHEAPTEDMFKVS